MPRLRTLVCVIALTALLIAGAPLRQLSPGVGALLLQIGAGVAIYGGVALAFDVAGLRSLIAPKLMARLRLARS